jgi:hypothetical protein
MPSNALSVVQTTELLQIRQSYMEALSAPIQAAFGSALSFTVGSSHAHLNHVWQRWWLARYAATG